ncbi:MAG: ABC transporter permease [Chloroflexus sp.]|uniref:ABC transporter permease n=1 Tax=Chloroflexus sp. TaxID=1904827 RepID=UPI00404935AF
MEPRENALKMNDLRLRKIAEQLREARISGLDIPVSEQQYRYTSLQLAYAVLRKYLLSKPNQYLVEIVLTVISGVVFIVGLFFQNEVIVGISLVLLILPLLSVLTKIMKNAPALLFNSRFLMSFKEQFIHPWERIHGILPGRITADEIAALRLAQLPPQQVRAVLVSPIVDILDCLRANNLPQKLGIALIDPNQLTEHDEAIIALLRSHPRMPLLMLHDACATDYVLLTLLPKKWGLASHHRIVDLGLHPRHVQRLRPLWKRETPSKELLDLFEFQMSNGLALTTEERAWLRKGYTVSALFIPPAKWVVMVSKAVERLAPKPVVDPEVEAQAQARAVGFMSWPSSLERH